jgi:hypothetical protein
MAFKDFLPALLGVAAGAVSPQAALAGANTLEAYQQTKRRRVLDEQVAKDRETQEMDAAAARRDRQRARVEHTAEREYQAGERARVAREREAAQAAVPGTLEYINSMGIELTPAQLTAIQQAESGAELNTMASNVVQVHRNAPMSLERANELDADWKKKNIQGWVPVYHPGGGVVNTHIGAQSSTAGGTTKAEYGKTLSSLYGVDEARDDLAVAADYSNRQALTELRELREDNPPPKNAEDNLVSGKERIKNPKHVATFGPEHRVDNVSGEHAVAKAKADLKKRINDLRVQLAKNPQLAEQLQPQIAALEGQMQGGAPPEQVEKMKAKYGKK